MSAGYAKTSIQVRQIAPGVKSPFPRVPEDCCVPTGFSAEFKADHVRVVLETNLQQRR